MDRQTGKQRGEEKGNLEKDRVKEWSNMGNKLQVGIEKEKKRKRTIKRV